MPHEGRGGEGRGRGRSDTYSHAYTRAGRARDYQAILASACEFKVETEQEEGRKEGRKEGRRYTAGLVNFVPPVACLFCLNLLAAFSHPENGLTEISVLHDMRGL